MSLRRPNPISHDGGPIKAKASRWTFALAVGAALAFGGSQAAAAPAAGAELRVCDPVKCADFCRRSGAFTSFCFGQYCVCGHT